MAMPYMLFPAPERNSDFSFFEAVKPDASPIEEFGEIGERSG